MANPNKLKIVYQPAQKSIDFELYKNDELLSDGSIYPKLNRYSKKDSAGILGSFVLQMQGPDFLDDLLSPFSPSITPVMFDVITTAEEYEDFEEIIEAYNQTHSNRISLINPVSKILPGMEDCSNFIGKYGKSISKNLKNLIEDLKSLGDKNDYVKRFITEIDSQAKRIDRNIESFTNNVNICFVGITSTGKSTLINSLLGFDLLTMKDDPETSKVYEIHSPDAGEDSFITFDYKKSSTKIYWSGKTPVIQANNKEAEDFIKIEPDEDIKVQLKNIIAKLNDKENKDFIGDKITVGVPIPFDTPLVHYTLYDTPGTDSLDEKHQQILMDTLWSQTDTIMAFVIHAKSMECSGNTILLQDIKKADGESNKTKIDLDRSFFILNTADDASELDSKYQKSIVDKKAQENGENFEIKLANKKLFFTSSKLAYLSQKEVLTEDEQIDYEALKLKAKKRFYQFNRIGESQLGSKRLLERTQKHLEEVNGNEKEVDCINSGIWSLREEIIKYGEKYAPAVKTAAISNVINNAVKIVNTKMEELVASNEIELDDITKKLQEFKDRTRESIENIVNEKNLINETDFNNKIAKSVGLSADYITKRVDDELESLFERIFGKTFGLGFINQKKTNDFMIGFKGIVQSYYEDIKSRRRIYLIAAKTDMLEAIKSLITADNTISDEIKKLISGISDPIIPEISTSIGQAVRDIHSGEGKFVKFFTNITSGKWHIESKKSLKESFFQLWSDEFEKVKTQYINDFISANNGLCNDVKKKFEDRIDDLRKEFVDMQENIDLYKKMKELLTTTVYEIDKSRKEMEIHIL